MGFNYEEIEKMKHKFDGHTGEKIDRKKVVEKAVENLDMNIKVAVMGCAVNGPGEARDADFGVACGDNCGLLFKKGEIVKKVAEEDIVSALLDLIYFER